MSGWISVKERLPEELPENTGRKTISCLVALKSCYPKGKATIQKRQRQWIPYYDGSFVGWEWSRIGAQRVTHWMPLPDPPKEGCDTNGEAKKYTAEEIKELAKKAFEA